MEVAERMMVSSTRNRMVLYTGAILMHKNRPRSRMRILPTDAEVDMGQACGACTASALRSRGQTHIRYAHKIHSLNIAPYRIGCPSDLLYYRPRADRRTRNHTAGTKTVQDILVNASTVVSTQNKTSKGLSVQCPTFRVALNKSACE